MPNQVLQVAAVIAAGVVSRPGTEVNNPEKTAKEIVALARALIKEAEKY